MPLVEKSFGQIAYDIQPRRETTGKVNREIPWDDLTGSDQLTWESRANAVIDAFASQSTSEFGSLYSPLMNDLQSRLTRLESAMDGLSQLWRQANEPIPKETANELPPAR